MTPADEPDIEQPKTTTEPDTTEPDTTEPTPQPQPVLKPQPNVPFHEPPGAAG